MMAFLAVALGFISALAWPSLSSAQTLRAITQDGRTVILNPNGTWEYADAPARRASPSMTKPLTARTLVKGKGDIYGIWIDDSKWKLSRASSSKEDIDKVFRHAQGDAYAMIIAERTPIPLASLKQIVLSNAQEAAPDAKIVHEEQRVVNGVSVLALRTEGTVQGVPFVYYGYYYSGAKGTVQVITYTSRSLFDEFRRDFDDFLNGFVAQ